MSPLTQLVATIDDYYSAARNWRLASTRPTNVTWASLHSGTLVWP